MLMLLLAESFHAGGENYSSTLNILKARFGENDLQIEVHVRGLLKLVINNAVSQNN